ncbi:hypothetical protein AB1K62_03415 [Parasphingorhabdus sp. JC815]
MNDGTCHYQIFSFTNPAILAAIGKSKQAGAVRPEYSLTIPELQMIKPA